MHTPFFCGQKSTVDPELRKTIWVFHKTFLVVGVQMLTLYAFCDDRKGLNYGLVAFYLSS
tara:strand:+ start:403 stop:582 length:180 start_codon:yes stop_codon:yes gene_type:complete